MNIIHEKSGVRYHEVQFITQVGFKLKVPEICQRCIIDTKSTVQKMLLVSILKGFH
jgi:hypothetical protein